LSSRAASSGRQLFRRVAGAARRATAGGLAAAPFAASAALGLRVRASTRRLLATALVLGLVRHRVSPGFRRAPLRAVG